MQTRADDWQLLHGAPAQVLGDLPPSTLRSRLGTHIPGLDALRGFSASIVVASHLGLLPGEFGYLGVSIFFAISGFLITWLLLRERDSTGTVSLTAFYARRSLRIFPAFYVFWILCIVLSQQIGEPISRREIWFTFFNFADYYQALRYLWWGSLSMMAAAWSLGVEEKFYLIWPAVFRRWRHSSRLLSQITMATIACVFLYRVIVWSMHPPYLDYLRYAFEARLDNIAFGCLLAITVYEGYATTVITLITNRALYPAITLGVLIGAVFIEFALGSGFFHTVGMTINSILILILLIQLVCLARTSLRWLEVRPLRWLGRISYSLYLYHLPVITLVNHYVHARWRVQLVCSIILSLLAAVVSREWIEKPFLRMKERFSMTAPATSDVREVLAG